tara:strand:+ start:151 stop:354 length:204 start_codon:yes stop_codon:yes gene_type:complete
MGLYEDITSYFWSWMVYGFSNASLYGCWYTGVWGLVIDNDDGKMIDTCFGIVGGMKLDWDVGYTYTA